MLINNGLNSYQVGNSLLMPPSTAMTKLALLFSAPGCAKSSQGLWPEATHEKRCFQIPSAPLFLSIHQSQQTIKVKADNVVCCPDVKVLVMWPHAVQKDNR